jgi:hypothetical protein
VVNSTFVESVCEPGYRKLVNLEPDDWGKRLCALIRRGLILAGYACLGTALWILGWKGTFTAVLWLTGIGAALQSAHLLPKPPMTFRRTMQLRQANLLSEVARQRDSDSFRIQPESLTRGKD